MKKEILSKAIDNIDTSLIEKSLGYKPRAAGGAKIRIIALAACLAIIVTAIPAALIMNREYGKDAPVVTTPDNVYVNAPNTNDEKVNNPNDDAIKVIYCDAEMLNQEKDIRTNLLSDNKVVLKEFVPYKNKSAPYEIIEYSEDIPAKLTVSSGGKEYTCVFDYAFNNRAILSTNAQLRANAKLARYKIDQEGYEGFVIYRVATQKIINASIKKVINIPDHVDTDEEMEQWYEDNVYGDVTEEERRILADRDIKAFYGDDVLSKFEYSFSFETLDTIRYVYVRNIGGFSTKEQIQLGYDSNGELTTILTYELGTYDLVEHLMTEKIIETAEKEVVDIINNNLVDAKELVMNNDGNLCIYYKCKYSVDNEIKTFSFYSQVG